MKAIFCDRCKKLIPPANATTRMPAFEIEVVRTIYAGHTGDEPVPVIIDLCRDCQAELNDFLNENTETSLPE